MWKEAKFLLIDNKKRILVPFLSVDRENVIGVLSLVKDAEGKTTFDMTVRKDLVNKSAQLPFWKRGVWSGYFMALDKDILGIKNGNPGLSEKLVDKNSKVKNQNSKTAREVCGDVPVREICITYHECDSYDYGETWTCVAIYEDCYYEYDYRCWDVPDEPVDPPTDPDPTCPEGFEMDINGNCIPIECEEDYRKGAKYNRVLTNKNKLCGTYSFKTVGHANVVNISGLGFSATGPNCHRIFVDLPTVCVTIPNYNLPLTQCSAKFNLAWANTMNQIMAHLNSQGIINPTPWALRELIIEYLIINLNSLAGLNSGVSIITGTCPGTNHSTAVYCQ